jgi:hypothetical protein
MRLRAKVRAAVIEESREQFEDRLCRVNLLIQTLADLAREETLERSGVRVAATLVPVQDERRKKRDRLVELGMQAYEELCRICASEQAAKEACRMQAYRVMAQVGAFNAAVISDQESEDLSDLIYEIEEKNQQFTEEVEKLKKKRRELEEEEHARYP